MKIEAVIISANYGDFLEQTLPENASHLDDIIVVTTPDDKKTQAVCNKNSVHFITTDCFTEYDHTFNKGAAINRGLDELRGEDWILHLDADIVLCKDFRRMLDKAQLKRENIYGCDRVNVYGWEAWQNLKPQLSRHYQDRWFVDPGFSHKAAQPQGTRLGTRVVHKEYGWVCIGFMQLFHSSHNRRYNVKRGAASGTDVLFPTQWKRENRVLLPELTVYHLDSETEHRMGTNWKGRKSRPFGPIGDAIKQAREHVEEEVERLRRELAEALERLARLLCPHCHRHHHGHCYGE